MSGRDDNRGGRRHRRRHFSQRQADAKDQNRNRYDKNGVMYERPRWVPPQLNTDPIPEPLCAYCGAPIKDINAAIEDKISGGPVHFDCIISRLSKSESLEKGEVISYIGGGRFGIVRFKETGPETRPSRRDAAFAEESGRVFSIRKIFEMEDKERRAEWRGSMADHYSMT
ncbi:MAG: hypothetical protein LBP29_02130 [Treponema sp.]|jgi:hypothetical protein|nr:hypothetical protein [Treponema sp.]